MPPPASIPRPPWPLLLAAAALVAGCTGGPTVQRPRPLSSLTRSTEGVVAAWWSPQRIASDSRRLWQRVGGMVADELDFGTMRDRSREILAAEFDRPRPAQQSAERIVAAEFARLPQVSRSRAWSELDPTARTAALAVRARHLPELLQLDRRALGEPDDLRHRTDPHDDRPEAGWFQRLLRRLFP